MKKVFFSLVFSLCGVLLYGQDLPNNPEPGKCYVRCTKPDVYKKETVRVMVAPSYKKIVTYPAQYKTVEEKVLIKEAGEKLMVVPAVWGTQEITYFEKEDGTRLEVKDAVFTQESETVETRAATAKLQMAEKMPNCESNNPDDCRYWCYKPVPAEFKTLPVQGLQSDAKIVKIPLPGVRKSNKRRVMLQRPTTTIVQTPPEYKTITKTVLVSDARSEEVVVPAVYRNVTKDILLEKGGLTS